MCASSGIFLQARRAAVISLRIASPRHRHMLGDPLLTTGPGHHQVPGPSPWRPGGRTKSYYKDQLRQRQGRAGARRTSCQQGQETGCALWSMGKSGSESKTDGFHPRPQATHIRVLSPATTPVRGPYLRPGISHWWWTSATAKVERRRRGLAETQATHCGDPHWYDIDKPSMEKSNNRS